MTLLDLLPDARGTPAERFHAWIAANPAVYELFKRFAREARDAGLKRFSADAICHRIRWFVSVETRGDEWKINNDYSASLARMLIAECPEFEGFFELRRVKG